MRREVVDGSSVVRSDIDRVGDGCWYMEEQEEQEGQEEEEEEVDIESIPVRLYHQLHHPHHLLHLHLHLHHTALIDVDVHNIHPSSVAADGGDDDEHQLLLLRCPALPEEASHCYSSPTELMGEPSYHGNHHHHRYQRNKLRRQFCVMAVRRWTH